MYGSGNYSVANYGTGVAEAYGLFASTSTVNTFGIAVWESTHSEVNSTSSLTDFGGLLKGGTTSIYASTITQDNPVFQWVGFGSDSPSVEISIYGYIAWDGQEVSDTTWTTQEVD